MVRKLRLEKCFWEKLAREKLEAPFTSLPQKKSCISQISFFIPTLHEIQVFYDWSA